MPADMPCRIGCLGDPSLDCACERIGCSGRLRHCPVDWG
jgi:hypothetical protein